MRFSSNTPYIILGLTNEGTRFRPIDWAERLCVVLSAFVTEKRMKYSPFVSPGHVSDAKAVFVDGDLYDADPMAYRFVLNFAVDNNLQLIEGSCPIRSKYKAA